MDAMANQFAMVFCNLTIVFDLLVSDGKKITLDSTMSCKLTILGLPLRASEVPSL